jgi:hypothetical protein
MDWQATQADALQKFKEVKSLRICEYRLLAKRKACVKPV